MMYNLVNFKKGLGIVSLAVLCAVASLDRVSAMEAQDSPENRFSPMKAYIAEKKIEAIRWHCPGETSCKNCHNLCSHGDAILQGRNGNTEEAWSLFEDSAQKGCASSQYMMFRLYKTAHLCKGGKWLKLAANNGHPDAKCLYGRKLLLSKKASEEEKAVGLRMLEEAAQQELKQRKELREMLVEQGEDPSKIEQKLDNAHLPHACFLLSMYYHKRNVPRARFYLEQCHSEIVLREIKKALLFSLEEEGGGN